MNKLCRLFASVPLFRNRLICKFPAANTRQPYHLTRRLQSAGDKITNPEEDEFEDQLPFSIDPRSVVGDDPEKIEALKNLMLEVELLMQTSGKLLPKSLTPKEWLLLLVTKTSEARHNVLKSIYVNRQRLEGFERNSDRKRDSRLKYQFPALSGERPKLETSTLPAYRLGITSMFQRITDRQFNKLRNFRLARAAMFGPDIFIDCSYDEYMTGPEKIHCAYQLLYAFSSNRDAAEPFNYVLCNANKEGFVIQKLLDLIPNLYDDSFITVTEKSFTEFHPKEKFVYLTPDCYEDLETYDHDSYYIIGYYFIIQSICRKFDIMLIVNSH